MKIINSTKSGVYDHLDLLNALPSIVYVCNVEGIITYLNLEATIFFDHPIQLDKDNWQDLLKIYKPDGIPIPLKESAMALNVKETSAVIGGEIIIENAKGKRLQVLPKIKPLFNSAGEIMGSIHMFVEITETHNKRMYLSPDTNSLTEFIEQNSQHSNNNNETSYKDEHWYHKMVEEVEDYAILLLDTKGNVQNWNLGAQKIKGYSREEIVGKNFSLFYLAEDRESNLPQTLIKKAAIDGKAMHEGWRLKKNGEKFWGFIVLTALHDDDNNIIGFSKVTRDLTERKLLEDQLKENAISIEIRNKQLQEYAHVASHDLQEPLRKIRIFSEMLSNKIIDDEALTYLRKIESSATRMTKLIQDVLIYSEIAEGQQIFATTDLNKVLNDVKEDCELWIQDNNITFKNTHLPVINAVPIQIHQLFSNLITNALKYSKPGGTISVTGKIVNSSKIKNTPDLKPHSDYLQLIFLDNGIGFDTKYSDKIFKLFQRLHTSQQGTGIGLALCKKIIENHAGSITVKSKVNEGTEFIIYLPV